MTITQIPGDVVADISLPEESVMEQVEQQRHRPPEEEFCAVIEQYADFSYNVALRILHRQEDAEDAVQEAFLSAYRAFPSFKGQSKVSTWLYRIVVNACLMRIRKDKSRAKYLTQTGYEDAVVYDWTTDPERSAENSELQDRIRDGLSRLSPELRAAVVLRDVQELSTDEAAEILDISPPALKSRLHRGRILLRKYLEEGWREL